jgi:hypothetical protein
MAKCHVQEAQGFAVLVILVVLVPMDCGLPTGCRVEATRSRLGVRVNLQKAVLGEFQSRVRGIVRVK